MKRIRNLILVVLAATSMIVVSPAPGQASTCDEIDRPVCEAAGGICFLLYKLHVNSDQGCLG